MKKPVDLKKRELRVIAKAYGIRAIQRDSE